MKLQLVIMANNRPKYFHEVANYWTKVRGLERWSAYVSLEPSDRLESMHSIATSSAFPVHVNPARYGVLHHPWEIMDQMILGSGADFTVIAEDDVLVSDDILEYFAWVAERFADEHVLAVSAASFYETVAPHDLNRVVVHDGFTPMCWGTWDDRWSRVLRDTWDHNYSSGTPEAPQAGWDWNIDLRIIPQGGWQIVSPVASRADHIGFFGTHTSALSFPGSRSATFLQHRDPGEFHL